MPELAQIRETLRARRRALPLNEQQRTALALQQHFSGHALFRHSRHIAFYLPMHGEADPGLLLQEALQHGIHCYLPRLHQQSLQFFRYREGDALQANRFGIAEPVADPGSSIAPQALDLVLMPLVAFDDAGTRLGMGGGYYDRSFAFRREAGSLPKPSLIGVAYAFQETARLKRAAWDVPLDGVLTEQGLRLFSR